MPRDTPAAKASQERECQASAAPQQPLSKTHSRQRHLVAAKRAVPRQLHPALGAKAWALLEAASAVA